MTYAFDLVSDAGPLQFGHHGFERARFLLSELTPATNVLLIGSPPSRIRVYAQGERGEIAPALLAQIESLSGTTLRYELAD